MITEKAGASEAKRPGFQILYLLACPLMNLILSLGPRGSWGCLCGRLSSGPQRYPGPNPWNPGSVTLYGKRVCADVMM